MDTNYETRDARIEGVNAVELVCVRCDRVVGVWRKAGPWPITVAEAEAKHDAKVHQ